MNYEVLLFDADETLFDFKKAERYALKQAMAELSLPYDESLLLPVYTRINSGVWKEFERGEITQEALKTERFRRFAKEAKIRADAAVLAGSYAGHLADASFLLDGSMELIMALKESYRMIIVTNGLKKTQEKRIKQSVLAGYFEDVIISEAIGLSKPDPRIFEYALKVMHFADKSKALIIGDSLTSDIKGGNRAGIDTCWYNPAGVENHTDSQPTFETRSYQELEDLLLK